MMHHVHGVERALPAGLLAFARPRRVPARRPGDFHLLAQMKVTKAKGLNTDLVGVDGCKLARSLEHRRTSFRFLADPSSRCDVIDRKSPLGGRRRSSERFGRLAQSALLVRERSKFEPQEVRRRCAASKSTRERPELLVDDKPRALTQQMSGQIGIQALCFGDFHLCQQMKVTRPPGRDPAPMGSTVPPGRKPGERRRCQRRRAPPRMEPSTPRMISRPTLEPIERTAERAAASASPSCLPPRGPVVPKIASFSPPSRPPPASAGAAAVPAPAASVASCRRRR